MEDVIFKITVFSCKFFEICQRFSYQLAQGHTFFFLKRPRDWYKITVKKQKQITNGAPLGPASVCHPSVWYRHIVLPITLNILFNYIFYFKLESKYNFYLPQHVGKHVFNFVLIKFCICVKEKIRIYHLYNGLRRLI